MKILKKGRRHPNIVTFIDYVRASGRSTSISDDEEEDEDGAIERAIVLEVVDFEDHRTLWPRLEEKDVRFYMRELASALEWTHGKGIIHLDLRGENILIDHSKRQVPLPPYPPLRYPG